MRNVTIAVLIILAAGAVGAQTPNERAAEAAVPPVSHECCAPLPPGNSAWWTFDEPSGPTANDIGGSVNNAGTDHGAVQRGLGMVGRAVSFNGATWITVPDQAEINFGTGDGTIDFWIRTTETGHVEAILDKRVAGSGNTTVQGYSVYLWKGQPGLQLAAAGDSTSCSFPTPPNSCQNSNSAFPVNDGKWHFVAITFARSGVPSGMFYVDGQTSTFKPKAGNITTTAPLLIGAHLPTLGGATNFNGTLDELEFFKRALSKGELDLIYRAGPFGKCRRFSDR